MAEKYENKEGYAFFNGEPSKMGVRKTLTVTVMLDSVPGAYHQIEDHIKLMMRTNPYVQTIEIVDDAAIASQEDSEDWNRSFRDPS